jgi:F-type H+-transporting ATPase subunit alpha
MSSSIFAEGFRPAVDLNLSLSIIGGRVQPPLLKALSRNLRADYARYTEIVRLSKMGSGLSEDAERTVRRGDAIISILQQGQHSPVSTQEEILLLYGLHSGMLDGLSKEERSRFTKSIRSFASEKDSGLLDRLGGDSELTPELDRDLKSVMNKYFAGQG